MEIPNIIKRGLRKKESAYVTILLASLILGFFIPSIIYGRPLGTDTYTHIEETKDMADSSSLYEFYEESYRNALHPTYEGNTYNYPFGLWLFGANVSKITGIDSYTTSYLLSFIIFIILILTFYMYFDLFQKSPKDKILSVLFFLSTPTILLNLLSYRSSVFTMPFVLIVTYSTLNRELPIIRSLFFTILSVFVIVISHTGSFIFFLFFSISFLMLYSITFGRLHKKCFLLVTCLFLLYCITMSLFPEILPQYTNKSRMILTTGEFVSSKLSVPLISDLSQTIYQRVFVELDFLYVIFFVALFFSIAKLLELIHIEITSIYRKRKTSKPSILPAIPLLGSIDDISHSIVAAPIWLGPIHSTLSVPGFFKLKTEYKLLFISVFIVTVLPGYLTVSETGSTREIFYLYLILPVTAVLGLYWVCKYIEENSFLIRIKPLLPFLLFGLVSSFIVIPAVGNMYYLPKISHEKYQVDGMTWLSKYGNTTERIEGYGYRDLRILTGKRTLLDQLMDGKEISYFKASLRKIFFSSNSETYVEDLYTIYNLKYYVSSKKIIENLGGDINRTKINENKDLDKLYSSKDFSIFANTPQRETKYKIDKKELNNQIEYNEQYPAIIDRGADFLVETSTYRIRLNKINPTITYLGDGYDDLLGEGYLKDYIKVDWNGVGRYSKLYTANYFEELNNFAVSIKGNELTYSTVLQYQTEERENWSSLTVSYTFYEKAIKKEIIASNDWVASFGGDTQDIKVSSFFFLPSQNFTYTNFYGQSIQKRIYPSTDSITIKEKINEIYFDEQDTGLYIKYIDSSPLPDTITFKGSILNEYSSFSISQSRPVLPGESIHITQYITLGELELARSKVKEYVNTKVYPYKNASPPLILLSYLKNKINSETSIIRAYEKLRELNITSYAEGINSEVYTENPEIVNNIKEYRVTPLISENLFKSGFSSYEEQEAKLNNSIKRTEEEFKTKIIGFVPSSLRYNLNTIKILDNKNFSFIANGPIRSPVYEYYHEGLRNPSRATYQGVKTNILLLPVSSPTSNSLTSTNDQQMFINYTYDTLKSILENDGAAIFLWNSEELGNSLYFDAFNHTLSYARTNRFTVTSIDDFIAHLRLIDQVSIFVDNEVDVTRYEIVNNNNVNVEGFTFEALLPKLDGSCRYITSKGRVVRASVGLEDCRIYITVDLEKRGTILVEVYPEIKKELIIELSNPQPQGIIELSLKDDKGLPIQGGNIQINNKNYKTDEKGQLRTYLRKGEYIITAGKRGFNKKTVRLDVVDRINFIIKRIV